MRRRDRFVTSRHDQGQPLGIVAAGLHPDGTALHGTGLRAFGAAAHCVIKIGQAQITLVVGSRKPFRRHAANPLAARYVHAKAAGNRLLVLGQGHHGHRSFSFWGWVKAQRCAATLPVGETGVARARAAGVEGDHPPEGARGRARLHAPGAHGFVKILRRRGRPGRPLRPAPASVLHPCAREGGALSDRLCEQGDRRSFPFPSAPLWP